eukprot:TRINITY_DN7076_c0_g1_i1.p1 TRINITY_DN7076_c0_g1~~TRINITY_DN7076_c0_g1_i1.p1  ORF type:complete len:246 (-),score=46.30 TRINITY_DN7076_c0_g1_i1:133-870(-)
MGTRMLALIALLVLSVRGEFFNPDKLQFIDNLGSNFLFRGNEPMNASYEFAYDQVVDTMQDRLASLNMSLPPRFFFVDINLLSKEIADILVEEAFFDSHPSLGNFTHYIIIGELAGPDLYTTSQVKDKSIGLDTWSFDRLPTRIPDIRNILESSGPDGIPLVLYIHCEAGSDRTGEVSGGYYLTYSGFTSFAEAVALDDKIAGRPIEKPSYNGLQWYCYYLMYAKNYNISCESPPSLLSVSIDQF